MLFLLLELLIEEPDFLVLDEPYNGLDNHGVDEMRELFLELKKVGKLF